ncbi:MAG: hypothetical protein AAFQ54_15295 [Pseudomonadota bacterium]
MGATRDIPGEIDGVLPRMTRGAGDQFRVRVKVLIEAHIQQNVAVRSADEAGEL